MEEEATTRLLLLETPRRPRRVGMPRPCPALPALPGWRDPDGEAHEEGHSRLLRVVLSGITNIIFLYTYIFFYMLIFFSFIFYFLSLFTVALLFRRFLAFLFASFRTFPSFL